MPPSDRFAPKEAHRRFIATLRGALSAPKKKETKRKRRSKRAASSSAST